MRTIYTLLVLSIVLAAALLALSFVYFAKTTHENLYYMIYLNGAPWGEMEIDRYATENNIIYKAKEFLPYESGLTRKSSKLTLDRRSNTLREYAEERFDDATKELYYLKLTPGALSFLAIAKSKFATLEDMEVKKDALPFQRNYIASWAPFVRMYNYQRGGAQSFNALEYRIPLLPPRRCTITFTSIRDEYIDVDNKKVKTECLLLKELGEEQIFVWVAKNTHNIVAVEIPNRNIYVKNTSKRGVFAVKDYSLSDKAYISKKITFSSKEREVTGTLTRPKEKGTYPAVILVSGENAFDQNNSGIYVDLTDYLAKHGYVVLRFNLQIGPGGPKFQSISIDDELSALSGAINMLEEYRFVDVGRIGIIAHSDANFVQPYFIKKEPRIKALVMLSPNRLAPIINTDTQSIKAAMGKISQADIGYEKTVIDSSNSTLGIVEESTKNWKNLMGEKVFLGRMKEILRINPFEGMKDITIPMIAVHGKIDELYSTAYAEKLKEFMNTEVYTNRSSVFFRKLNHYLGNLFVDELIRKHYEMDKEVLETVTGWLDKHL